MLSASISCGGSLPAGVEVDLSRLDLHRRVDRAAGFEIRRIGKPGWI